MEKYNNFVFLENVKRMLKNQWFCIDRIDSRLAHVESHIVCESNGGDLMDPSGSSARALENISSSGND